MNGSAGEAPEPLLSAHGLTVGYGLRAVASGVRLEIRAGERWFFVGPNGSGKTTMLRVALGLLPPLAGEIRLHVPRERVGFVPQRCDLNPSLPTTLREFVRLGAVGLGLSREEIRRRIGAALREVGLPGPADGDYWALSGGQRQRALVARALVRHPALLVLDEPTNGLDLAAEETLLAFVDRVNREENVTPLFVTHDLRLAARHATHVALFGGGTVKAGTRDQILTGENLAGVYGVDVRAAAARLFESPDAEGPR